MRYTLNCLVLPAEQKIEHPKQNFFTMNGHENRISSSSRQERYCLVSQERKKFKLRRNVLLVNIECPQARRKIERTGQAMSKKTTPHFLHDCTSYWDAILVNKINRRCIFIGCQFSSTKASTIFQLKHFLKQIFGHRSSFYLCFCSRI